MTFVLCHNSDSCVAPPPAARQMINFARYAYKFYWYVDEFEREQAAKRAARRAKKLQ